MQNVPPQEDNVAIVITIPDNLPKEERDIWDLVLQSAQARHISPGQIPLIRHYVKSCVQLDMLAAKLDAATLVSQASYNKILAAYRSMAKVVASLCSDLKLNREVKEEKVVEEDQDPIPKILNLMDDLDAE